MSKNTLVNSFISADTGLTSDEVLRQKIKYGENAIPDTTTHPLRTVFQKFWAPIPWMLEATIIMQLAMGKNLEASIIIILLLFNAIIGVFQEGRAQATLATLKSKLALTATARRDGVWETLRAVELVPGDIIKLSMGGIVAADCRLMSGKVLIDQSMLTGESLAIEASRDSQLFAGSLVRRGEATAEITATGALTKFGRTAELVYTANVVSSQQKAVLHVVLNLGIFNGFIILCLIFYAFYLNLSLDEIIPLVLTAVLASIPVALPSTFTLAAALGARNLAKLGVLPTRLSAVDEAAMMDILCSDKTGTLTKNELSVNAIFPVIGYDEAHVLELALLCSSDSGQDPVDLAIRNATRMRVVANNLKLISFEPFDPQRKLSSAIAAGTNGSSINIVKGAFDVVSSLTQPETYVKLQAQKFEEQGFRVLAVASGQSSSMVLIGIIALSDPPNPDSAALISELRELGVRTVMVTGDASATASVVAKAVGLESKICPPGPFGETFKPQNFSVFAGVLPEDKYDLVRAFQRNGHIVGMCGDGVNDAPALRQAQIGIAVSTATEVAKSAAGIVLTKPGIHGVLAAVKEGRIIFERILSYTLNSITKKITQVLFLAAGLIMTGHTILTPMLMVLIMITGDFLGMALTTDNVRPSQKPNMWNIGSLTVAGIFMGVCELIYCTSILAFGVYHLRLDTNALQTLAFILIVFGNQATAYNNRERLHLWSSSPSNWLIFSTILDISIASALAMGGYLMSPLSPFIIISTLLSSIAFGLVLDLVKMPLFARLSLSSRVDLAPSDIGKAEFNICNSLKYKEIYSKKILAYLLFVILTCSIGYLVWNKINATVNNDVIIASGLVKVQEVDVLSHVSGRIIDLKANEGDNVNQGQVLARLDIKDQKIIDDHDTVRITSLHKRLNIDQFDLGKKKSLLHRNQKEFEKSLSLLNKRRRSQKFHNHYKYLLDQSINEQKKARNKIIIDQRNIQLAEHAVKANKTKVNDSFITAPISGRIQNKTTDVGELLKKGAVLYRILNNSNAYMDIYINRNDAEKISKDTDSTIVLDTMPTISISAKASVLGNDPKIQGDVFEQNKFQENDLATVRLIIEREAIESLPRSFRTGLKGTAYIYKYR